MTTPTPEQLEQWLTGFRYKPYLSAAHRDHDAAVRMYEWNTDVSSAFLQVFAFLEVLLRNAVNTVWRRWRSVRPHQRLRGMVGRQRRLRDRGRPDRRRVIPHPARRRRALRAPLSPLSRCLIGQVTRLRTSTMPNWLMSAPTATSPASPVRVLVTPILPTWLGVCRLNTPTTPALLADLGLINPPDHIAA